MTYSNPDYAAQLDELPVLKIASRKFMVLLVCPVMRRAALIHLNSGRTCQDVLCFPQWLLQWCLYLPSMHTERNSEYLSRKSGIRGQTCVVSTHAPGLKLCLA